MLKLSARSLTRPAAFLFAGFAALLVSSSRPGGANSSTLYLDARYNFEGTKLVGPREVVIVGPNPFRTRWTVSVEASTIPGPDLTKLTAALPSSSQKLANKFLGNQALTNNTCPQQDDPTLGFTRITADNFEDCITQFQKNIANLLRATKTLQQSEQDTITNVDMLLDTPGSPNPNVPNPAASPDYDQNARGAFASRYENNLNECVLNNTGCTVTLSAVSASPSPLPTDGNIPTIIADAKVTNLADAVTAINDKQLNDWISSNSSSLPASDLAQYKSELQTNEDALNPLHATVAGLLASAPPTNPLASPNPDAVFVQAPGQTWMGTFVFKSENNPTYSSCHGYLFNGVALKYVLSVSSPSPSPSPTTSTEPTGTQAPPSNGPVHQGLPKRVAVVFTRILDAGLEEQPAGSSVGQAGSGASDKTPNSGQTTSQTQTPTGMTAEVDCLPIAFVSAGYGVDTVPNVSYTSVPNNTATSAAGMAKGATIQKAASGARSVLTSLANFQIGQASDNGSSWAYSLGVGLPVSNPGPGWKFEILTGPSYTFARSFTLTLGGTFGSTYKLQPGYTLGGPIALKMAPPTQTANFTPGFFFSGNFYIPTGSMTTPKPSASPKKKG